MIELSEDNIEIVKEILAKHVPEYEVRAFGSRVNNQAKKYSDLDLVIIDEKKIPFEKIFALKNDFAESKLPFRVDILDWKRTSSEFRKIIEQNYEILQPKKK